jgi:hypothetical protein
MLYGVALVSSAMLATLHPAHAGGFVSEIKGGVLAHDVGGLWAQGSREERWVDLNVELMFRPVLAVFGGQLSPALGANINTAGDTSAIYLDARWQYEMPSGLFVGLGLGVAVHDGEKHLVDFDRKALGSQVLFHIPFEIGMRLDAHNSLSVYFEHTSNAGLANHNEGMDRLGLRYGYRF